MKRTGNNPGQRIEGLAKIRPRSGEINPSWNCICQRGVKEPVDLLHLYLYLLVKNKDDQLCLDRVHNLNP